MVELLAPGVYPIETSFRAPSLQGAGTSTTGFCGLTSNGPVGGPPRLVTSFPEYQRIYGGLADLSIAGLGTAPATNYLSLAVRGYFLEGGRRLYISRAFLGAAGSTGRASAARVGTETDARHLILRARFPGSGGNGTVTLSEVATPSTDATLGAAVVGTLARSRGVAATPAQAVAVRAPAQVGPGATLAISVGGGAAQNIVFAGAPAVATAQDPLEDTTDIPAGIVLTATIDGLTQAVAIAQGDDRTREQIRDEISLGLVNGVCILVGDTLAIRSNAAGSSVVVRVAQAPLLGFTDAETVSPGTPGLPRLDAVTPADINGLLAGAGIDAAADTQPGTGFLRLFTTATGGTASLDLSDPANAAALTALGFDPDDLDAPVTGTAGVARRIFVRETTATAGWRAYAEQPGGTWDPGGGLVDAAPGLTDTDHIVSLALSWESVDGVTTSYEGLGFAPAHPRYMGHRMTEVADPAEAPLSDPLVLVMAGLNPAEVHAALFSGATASAEDVLSIRIPLSGGNDGTMPTPQIFSDALETLNLVDDISIVAAPGSSAYAAIGDFMHRELIGHAERSNFRIAVCDPPPAQEINDLRVTRGRIDSTYAALYAPWMRIANPLYRPGSEAMPRELNVPPSGWVAGIYARNDASRGVHKTPANEIIREAAGFERDYNQRHQEVLNPIGINVLRKLDGRGNRVYGGRLATSDREIVYVSDRRFLNYLKQSIYNSMQWAVFEPNGPELWSDVREAVSSFLFARWREGALLGSTPEGAYFVRCDRSVITQDDLDNGRLVCEVGVAMVKPAEFLVFLIGQTTADART